MKHIWCIDDNLFTLKEGYVLNDYKTFEDDFVYTAETQQKILGTYKVENIFDNRETAINMFKGMIKIQMTKLQKHIDDCIRKREELFEKLIEII